MTIYTVHEPPLPAGGAVPDPQRFVFVRDRFSLWAFLLTPLWMLWHRLWLVLAIYLVVAAGLHWTLDYVGASATTMFLIALLISLLVGLEAATLRRFTLGRRGWVNVGIVNGVDLQDAEQRFFDGWLRRARAQPGAAAPAPPKAAATSVPRAPHDGGVIGLFPEPGNERGAKP